MNAVGIDVSKGKSTVAIMRKAFLEYTDRPVYLEYVSKPEFQLKLKRLI